MSCDFISMLPQNIQALKPYQAGKPIEELQRELGLKEIIKLASNENPLGTSYRVQDACARAFDSLALYPDSNGFELKKQLGRQLDVEPKCVTLGNGSNDLLDLIAQVFLNENHSAVYSKHAFVVYRLATQISGATAIEVPAKDWGHDLDAMAQAITENTRIVFLANPNNPTGTYFSHAEVEQFLSRVPEHVIVILDEAYYEYCEHLADYPKALELRKKYSNLVISRTFSKAYGLAGLRVGYMIANPEISDALNRVRAPFNVNTLAQIAACTALKDKEFLKQSVECNQAGLQQMEQGLQKLGLEYIQSVANFISVNVGDAANAYDALLRQGVIVRPIGVYDMPNHLRLSIGLEEENAFCLEKLAEVL